jgi:ribosome-associated protein
MGEDAGKHWHGLLLLFAYRDDVTGSGVVFGRSSPGEEVTNEKGTTPFAFPCVRIAPGLLPRDPLAEGGPLSVATVISSPTPRVAVGRERASHCARVAADNKARDVLVLDMRAITPLYDFVVLATGISRRQIHTLAEEIDAAMRVQGETRASIEGYEDSKWVVQDYGDVVVHVFDPDTRIYYALEELWADAPRLDWERE